MILDTPRLHLRPYRASDAPVVASYAAQEPFWRFLTVPPITPESAASFVTERLAAGVPDAQGNWQLVAALRDDGRVVGGFRLGVRETGAGDLGYSLDPAMWGQGLASEGARAMLAFGFGELRLERIWATADVANHRSWRTLQRIGMRREGILRRHRRLGGVWRDSLLYAVVRDDLEEFGS